MASPNVTSDTWDAVAATCLNNLRGTIDDNITGSNAVLYAIKQADGWKKIAGGIGNKCEVTLRYANATAVPYAGLDTLAVTETAGVTSIFWDWRQAAAPIAISRIDMQKNKGDAAKFNLLKERTQQAVDGMQTLFNDKFLVGKGSTHYREAFSNAGAYFVDPLPLLVSNTQVGVTPGGLDPDGTDTYWANQHVESSAAYFGALLLHMSHLKNLCSQGPGGSPNLYLSDLTCYETYCASQYSKIALGGFTKLDFPFENVLFGNKPYVFDENVHDVYTYTGTDTYSTFYALNTKFIEVRVDAETDFIATPFKEAPSQDGKCSQLLWYGTAVVSNRRKQGVLDKISKSITAWA